jgi:hypothetical protein
MSAIERNEGSGDSHNEVHKVVAEINMYILLVINQLNAQILVL